MGADIEQWPPPNDPSAFESLCLDLWKEILEDPGAQKNGRSGQPQSGVDIFGRQQGKWVGIQCKQKGGLLRTNVTVSELQDEVEAAKRFKPPLARFVLATTGPRDAKVQRRARELTEQHEQQGLFSVEVYSWEDIWHELYVRDEMLKRIAPNYWPRLATGRWGDEAALAPSRLIRSRNASSAFLIGRDKELKALDASWSEAKKNIVISVAYGGIGKTSLVAHWAAAKLAQPEHGGMERYFDWSFYSQGTRREGDAIGASHAASADLFLKEALEFFGDEELAASNAGAWQKGERLAQLVGRHRTLLILDGLEPLQDARTGELRDDGLRSLLRGLAAHNHGLCLITTRQNLPDLNLWHQTTALEWKLASLTDEAGAALLTKLGVNGTESEKRDLSASVTGHALTLTLLGRYLRRAHHGDIRHVDRLKFEKADESVQGGHAFRVIAAYTRWFEENHCCAELTILRMLGLFDRPATPDCLAALRNPPVPGLTDAIASLNERAWNEALSHLVELNLVEQQPWELRRIVGYSNEVAKLAIEAGRQNRRFPLGEPKPLENPRQLFASANSVDSHPLIREFFASRFRESHPEAWRAAHSRLFHHLQDTVPYWPEGVDGLQPLYQAISHGCQAGLHQEACETVYVERVNRGSEFYSTRKLGAFSSELAAVSCFFEEPWRSVVASISTNEAGWLLNSAAFFLRALGRLSEALEPMQVATEWAARKLQWNSAATSASNLSELELMLGQTAKAVRSATQAVAFAERSGRRFEQIARSGTLADALHQSGRRADALVQFKKAEQTQTEHQPEYPLLYSLTGFRYCDLLLAEAERAAWLEMITSDSNHSTFTPDAIASCHVVSQRTSQTLKWAEENRLSLLDVALDHLMLGRSTLYAAILERSNVQTPNFQIEMALQGLRSSGNIDELPRALLSRALLGWVQGRPDLARRDLDEAQELAERGQMRLHLADIHLHRARIFRDRGEMEKAIILIETAGYWRRGEEVFDSLTLVGLEQRQLLDFSSKLLLTRGDPQIHASFLDELIQVAKKRGDANNAFPLFLARARTRFRIRAYEQARWDYKMVLHLCRELHQFETLAEAEIELADLEYRSGLFEDARRHLEDAANLLAAASTNDERVGRIQRLLKEFNTLSRATPDEDH